MDKMSAGARLLHIIAAKKLNQSKIAERLGVKPAAVSKAINITDSISSSMAQRIKYLWPEFSMTWIMTGEGPIYEQRAFDQVGEPQVGYGHHLSGKVKELEGRVEQLEVFTNALAEDITELVTKLRQSGTDSRIDLSKYERWKS
jgi:transcriptional regulator with XRE-family HTH domain